MATIKEKRRGRTPRPSRARVAAKKASSKKPATDPSVACAASLPRLLEQQAATGDILRMIAKCAGRSPGGARCARGVRSAIVRCQGCADFSPSRTISFIAWQLTAICPSRSNTRPTTASHPLGARWWIGRGFIFATLLPWSIASFRSSKALHEVSDIGRRWLYRCYGTGFPSARF